MSHRKQNTTPNVAPQRSGSCDWSTSVYSQAKGKLSASWIERAIKLCSSEIFKGMLNKATTDIMCRYTGSLVLPSKATQPHSFVRVGEACVVVGGEDAVQLA